MRKNTSEIIFKSLTSIDLLRLIGIFLILVGLNVLVFAMLLETKDIREVAISGVYFPALVLFIIKRYCSNS